MMDKRGMGAQPPGGQDPLRRQPPLPPVMMDPRAAPENANQAGATVEQAILAAALLGGTPISEKDRKRAEERERDAAKQAMARQQILMNADGWGVSTTDEDGEPL